MKFIIFLILSLGLINSCFSQTEEEAECAGNGQGTNLVYVNGVGWSADQARENIEMYIYNAVEHTKIDPDGVVHPILSYNTTEGKTWDLLEAAALFIKNQNDILRGDLIYRALFRMAFLGIATSEYQFIFSFPSTTILFLASDIGKRWYRLIELKELEFSNLLESDTQCLVATIATLMSQRLRVVTIGDSQGTLYLNEMYRRLERDEVPFFPGTNFDFCSAPSALPQERFDTSKFDFEEQNKFVSTVYVAAVVAPNNPLNRVVLNANDVIRHLSVPASVGNEAPITFTQPLDDVDPLIEERTKEEVGLNHSLSQTYLNIHDIPHQGLQNLKKFTVDSIHEAAALLPVPCIYCVSEDFPDGQLGVETSYAFVANTATVTGNVVLRSGVEICGESVIEVLDDNFLVMDRSKLWDVKMSVSGVGQYTGEGYIGDSKLSNLEIQDSSTAARVGIIGSEINGGLIINNGTDSYADGRAEVSYSTLNNVNVYNSQISNSTLSGLSIEKSIVDSIFIDVGSGVNASYIYDSNVVNSYVGNSRIERSSIINSDILDNSEISESEIVGNTTRTIVRGSRVYNSGVTDSTLANTVVYYSSVTGSSLSGSFVSDCSVNGVNSSGYNCNSGEVYPW